MDVSHCDVCYKFNFVIVSNNVHSQLLLSLKETLKDPRETERDRERVRGRNEKREKSERKDRREIKREASERERDSFEHDMTFGDRSADDIVLCFNTLIEHLRTKIARQRRHFILEKETYSKHIIASTLPGEYRIV